MARKNTGKHLEILKRRAEVSRLLLSRNLTPDQIAVELGYSRATIFRDCQAIDEELIARSTADRAQWRARILAKIEQTEAEANQAWEESKKPRETTLSEKTEGEAGQDGAGGKAKTKKSIRKQQRDPLPAYHASKQWCIEQYCKIIGLYAPTKSTLTDISGDEPFGGIQAIRIIEPPVASGESNADTNAGGISEAEPDRGTGPSLPSGPTPGVESS